MTSAPPSCRGKPAAKRWGWKIKAVAALGGTLLGLFAVEMLLRVFGTEQAFVHQQDKVLGISLRPGASGWYLAEGKAYIQVNRHGMRDVERPLHKPPGTVRIAVLGDSFAEASQVALESTFWSCLERELTLRNVFSGKKVEVLNYGVDGHGTAQELLMLRQRVWAHKPDIVLLALLTGNDICNNSRTLEPDKMRPFFVFRDGELVLDDRFKETAGFRLRAGATGQLIHVLTDWSRTVQYTRRAVNAARQRLAQAPSDAVDSKQVQYEPGMSDEIYNAPSNPAWVEAWQITERLLQMMHEEVTAHRARWFVVTLTNAIQVHPDRGVRQQHMRALGVEDLTYPDRRIAEFLKHRGVAALNLAPELLRHAEESQVYLHGFEGTLGHGHWNEQGHALAGRQIARWLADELAGARKE